MKVWKLAASILVLGTIVISPKANAQNLLTPQQLAPLQNSSSPSYKSVETYFIQGLKQIESGDYRGAIANFNQVLNIDPNNAYAYIGRGFSRFSLGSYRGAKKDFDKALEITPDIAYAHFFRGFTLVMLEDKQGGIADLKQASILFKQEGEDELSQKADNAVKQIEAS
ncbi:TPR repeat-containing protein [Sphaerospermopsis reniformis]|uniref:TPR repeat-containing protein n=1 Tax=Sphaerospermopsis reniformis TaxID=531300 RepID=A0A479ZWX6_9CYAN|nr:tetratricopeptide repeat protein [Sphaerospermopsis reniformis]GCL35943.1 TPR repeat-containing protein [Sphaerospermopsis reniformis]